MVGPEYIRLRPFLLKQVDTERKNHSAGRRFRNPVRKPHEYRHWSHLPLLTTGIDTNLASTAAGLKHSSTNIIGIGLKGKPAPELATKCWMYFPESNSPYYRITVFSNYSPNNVPDINQYWSLMTETSESSHKPVDRATLVQDTIRALIEDKMITGPEQIVSTFLHSEDYGYPTPSVERDAILKQVLPALEKHGIYSRGRFGAWKYEVSNQDHSLMQRC